MLRSYYTIPDSKVHGANTGPIWGRQDPGWPHAGPVNFASGYSIASNRIFGIMTLRMSNSLADFTY